MWATVWYEVKVAFMWCFGMAMIASLVIGGIVLNGIGKEQEEIDSSRYTQIDQMWKEGLYHQEIKKAMQDNKMTYKEYWDIDRKYQKFIDPKEKLKAKTHD